MDSSDETYVSLLAHARAVETLFLADLIKRLSAGPEPEQAMRALFESAARMSAGFDHTLPPPEQQGPEEARLARLMAQTVMLLRDMEKHALSHLRSQPPA